MLILTRRLNETLMIGDDVTVTVLAVKGNQVRLGVNAPRDVPVHREEVYDRIQSEGGGRSPGPGGRHGHGHGRGGGQGYGHGPSHDPGPDSGPGHHEQD